MGNFTEKALHFFSSIHLNCPKNYNPADFYIKELSIIPQFEKHCVQKINVIIITFFTSKEAIILTFIDDGVTAFNSFSIRSAIEPEAQNRRGRRKPRTDLKNQTQT